jgi:hypothetical protein
MPILMPSAAAPARQFASVELSDIPRVKIMRMRADEGAIPRGIMSRTMIPRKFLPMGGKIFIGASRAFDGGGRHMDASMSGSRSWRRLVSHHRSRFFAGTFAWRMPGGATIISYRSASQRFSRNMIVINIVVDRLGISSGFN